MATSPVLKLFPKLNSSLLFKNHLHSDSHGAACGVTRLQQEVACIVAGVARAGTEGAGAGFLGRFHFFNLVQKLTERQT